MQWYPSWVRLLPLLALGTLLGVATFAAAPSCSLPEGEGVITGTLNAPDCWYGKFDLNPDFFAGVPYRSSLQLRIQSGGDYETFSDGVSILIDDVTQIRPSDDGTQPGLYGVPLSVSLPPAVVPPGVPVTPTANPSPVHFTLYLQRTCHSQNVALYAMDQVELNPDGTCDAYDAGAARPACSTIQPLAADGGAPDASDASSISDAAIGDAAPPQSLPKGRSSITFTSLFDGDPDEATAAKRLNAGTFHVYLADPRDICPGGLGPPPRCRGELTGRFSFYFQRGRPAQPFP
jgi:hypothetical protein